MLLWHLADDLVDEIFARFQKIIEADRLVHHALETAFVFGRYVQPLRRKNLGHRPVVAEQVNDEGFSQRLVDALICQESRTSTDRAGAGGRSWATGRRNRPR